MANKKANSTTTTTTDKSQKLLKLANKRVPKAIKAISLIGNFAAYGPTEAQSTFIVNALQKAVDQVKARLTNKKEDSPSFQMPS